MTDKELEQISVKVAKKLGWVKFRKECLPSPLNKEKRTIGVAPGNFRHQFVPLFTNNLAHAMKCVDWAVAHDYTFQLIRTYDASYEASFYNDTRKFVASEVLPSLAICLAFSKIK